MKWPPMDSEGIDGRNIKCELLMSPCVVVQTQIPEFKPTL